MNYYEHHLGDYVRDTAHLSMLEDAAYRRLLDAYYIREGALPSDLASCCKLARAQSKAEREAVSYVLSEFFDLREDGHHQERADREISRYLEKQPEAQRKKENAAERQRRAREHRKDLFVQLRARGIVARYDAPTAELVELLSQPASASRHAPVTRDDTATSPQSPVPKHQTPNTGNGQASYDNPHAPDGHGGTPDGGARYPVPPTGPSMAGAVCVALRSTGMASVNPSHPELLALLKAGAPLDAFVQAASTEKASTARNGFAYVLATVKGQMQDAAAVGSDLARQPRQQVQAQSFRERDRIAGMQRWEQATGQKHPELVALGCSSQPPAGVVIDIETAAKRIAV